ncbi:MAG: cytochrome P450 [Chloroflexota bacterium]
MYDLFTQNFKRSAHETFALMRQEAPIYAHTAPNGGTSWYVTRYEDVLDVLKDNVNFCKDVHHASDRRRGSSIQQRINENMLFSDPPDHSRLRALVGQAFTPRRIEQMAPRIQEITDELLGSVSNPFDLIARFALPLPVKVICDLLGIPEVDQTAVMDGSQAIISPGGKGLSSKIRRKKIRDFVTYLGQLFAKRRQVPQEDMISALVQAEAAGEKLNEAELSSMVALLLVTGYETTVNLFGNGALALLQNPEQLEMVLADETLWETAVEELLRFDGPVETSTTRWVRQDIQYKGHQMKRGDIMRVVLASANRDDSKFNSPQRLDLTREENRHLAFGFGIHYCLGAPLARLEGVIGLKTLFKRYPNLTLDCHINELQWRLGVLFRGLERLPLRW